MLSPAFAIALAIAVPNTGASLNQARQAYFACLGALQKTDLQSGIEPAVFEAKLATACSAQEATFRRIVVTADVASGVRRAESDRSVTEEVGYFKEEITARYRSEFASRTRPH